MIFKNLIYKFIKRISIPFWYIGLYFCLVHFYEPIPDYKDLKKGNLFDKGVTMTGIHIDEEKQLNLLEVFKRYKLEYDSFPRYKTSIPHQYFINNGSFESVDGEVYYCMIRHFKPRKIIEIGAGFSTLLAAQAIMKNKKEDMNYECELIAIDPYPNNILKKGFPGLSKLVSKKVQEINIEEFSTLHDNDILFIDSSHVLKIGNDVWYIYNEILPSLRTGVLVHIHDIFLPLNYPKNWVIKQGRFWNEQYILKAFLTFNTNYEILWAASCIHIRYPDLLEKSFASYDRNKTWPGSFWLRKIR
jgi:hypothetical protein